MENHLIVDVAGVMREAAKSQLGIFALMIVALCVIALIYFRKSVLKYRATVFGVLFAGVAMFGVATFRSTPPTANPVDVATPDRPPEKPDTAKQPPTNSVVTKPTRPATQTFNVTTWTNGRKGGGTDAAFFIVLYGSDGISRKFEFDGAVDRRFEKGAVDVFTITTPYVGDVKRIHVGHNDAGGSSPWALDKVEVVDQATGKSAVFVYNNWLSKTEGPKRIDQMLSL